MGFRIVGAVINALMVATVASMFIIGGIFLYAGFFISYFYRPQTMNDLIQCIFGVVVFFIGIAMWYGINVRVLLNIREQKVEEVEEVTAELVGPLVVQNAY